MDTRLPGQPSGRPCLALLVVALLALALSRAGAASGAEDASRAAGFIVDTGDGEPIYVVVTFATPASAIDLLRQADLGAVTVDFGGLGEAVCEIRGTGCDVSTCRQRLCQTGDPDSPFWQYWRQGENGWKLSPLGASDVEPADRDIAAWVWIGTNPELEPITWQELAERAGAPRSVASGDIGGVPAVYSSARQEAGDGGSPIETAVAGGVVALVVVTGGALAMWRRRAREAA